MCGLNEAGLELRKRIEYLKDLHGNVDRPAYYAKYISKELNIPLQEVGECLLGGAIQRRVLKRKLTQIIKEGEHNLRFCRE